MGKNSKPKVVHVDREYDFEITFLADNFESFIRGFVRKTEYDDRGLAY